MSSAPVRDLVRAFLAANYSTLPDALPVVETLNAQYQPDGSGLQSWVTLEFVGGSEDQAAMGGEGNNLFREVGIFQLHLFAPTGTGDTALVRQADVLRSLFRHRRLGSFRVTGVDPPDTGDGSADGAWFRASVAVEYQNDLIA